MRKINRFFAFVAFLLAAISSSFDTARAQTTQTISVSPSQLTFTATAGGAAPPAQVLSVTGSQAGVSFLVTRVINSCGNGWLEFQQSGFQTPGTVSVTVNPQNLAAGTCTATLFVSGGNVVQVPVTLNVTGASPLTVNPANLSFTYQLGSPIPAGQNLTVTATSALIYNVTVTTQNNVNWLQAGPTQGTTPGVVNVSVDPGTLVAGTYQGTVTLTPQGQGNTPFQVPVTLVVTAQPQLTITPSALVFNYQIGGAAPPAQSIELTSTGTVIGFTAQSNANWLVVTPGAATTPASLTVTIQTQLLNQPGSYPGVITITPLGVGSPQTVSVTANVGTTPFLNVSPNQLTFRLQIGGPNPPDQEVAVSSTGVAQAFTTQVTTQTGGNWLVVRTQNPTTTQPLVIGVNPAGLAPGTYRGNIALLAQGAVGTPPSVSVTLQVTNDPVLILGQEAVNFAFQTSRPAPPAVPVSVISSGAALSFQAAKGDVAWLVLTAPTGATPGSFFVGVNTTGLTPGTYEANITVTAPGTQNAPISLPVRLVVSNSALLTVSTGSLEFRVPVGASIQPIQNVAVSSTDLSALPFTVSLSTANNLNWLLTDLPQGGTTPRNVGLTVNPAGFGPGRYTGALEIASAGVANSPQRVSVAMVVQPTETLVANPVQLTFNQTLGGTAPGEQTIQVTASSGASLAFLASSSTLSGGAWLNVTPTAGNTPGQLRVTVSGGNLTVGTYSGSVVVQSSGAQNTLTIPVTLNVTAQRNLTLTPNALSFSYQVGAAAPAPQTIAVTSSGGPVNFTTRVEVEGQPPTWLNVSPASGATPGNLSVSITTTGLQPGTYRGTIRVISEAAANSPQTATVTLTVTGTLLQVSPSAMNFSFAAGGAPPGALQAQVASSGTPLNFTATVSTGGGGNWLSVSPPSGVTPGTLTVSVNPLGLPAGTYTGTVTIASAAAANSPRTIPVTFTISGPSTAPVIREVLHGATLLASELSAGLIFTIKGSGLGPSEGQVFSLVGGRVPTTLGGVRVLVDDIPAPLLFVRTDQINAIVPYAVANRFGARVRVEYFGLLSSPVDVRVGTASPGIFTVTQTGAGQGAILNQNNSVNAANNPADRGSVIAIYATGEGQTTPPGVDGGVNNGPTFPRPIGEVRVFIGGIEANVQYAGAAPTFVAGVMQVNAVVPQALAPGAAVPVVIRVGGVSSPQVATVAIR